MKHPTHIKELAEQLGIDEDKCWMVQTNTLQEMLSQYFKLADMEYILIYGKQGESMGVLGNTNDLPKMRLMAEVSAALLRQSERAEQEAQERRSPGH